MIKQIFPINILVKDLDFSEEFSHNLKVTSQALFAAFVAESRESRETVTDNTIPLFTEANMNTFPILREIREVFVDGFLELAESYPGNKIGRADVEMLIENDTGKMPMMSNGEHRHLHSHVSAAAFGILYLDDVDNEKHGGQLVLRDPAFHCNVGYSAPQQYSVETKKNRLVISPAYVWHEVTPYISNEDRGIIVVNLDIIPKQLQRILVAEHDG